MKNYLIKSLNRIKSTDWEWTDRAREGDIYPYYQKMHKISEASFHYLLQGEWEYIYLESEVSDVNQVFKDQFYQFYDIWKKEPCNILYCGPDTQMIQPTEIFGRFKNFMMFNYTDPKSTDKHPHYLNADIRYIPATMNPEIWEIGLEAFRDFDYWGGDQDLYNDMVWAQGLTPEQVIHPELAYQAFMLPGGEAWANDWNGCKFEDALIIHWHGSRSAAQKLALMEQLAQQIGLPLSLDK